MEYLMHHVVVALAVLVALAVVAQVTATAVAVVVLATLVATHHQKETMVVEQAVLVQAVAVALVDQESTAEAMVLVVLALLIALQEPLLFMHKAVKAVLALVLHQATVTAVAEEVTTQVNQVVLAIQAS